MAVAGGLAAVVGTTAMGAPPNPNLRPLPRIVGGASVPTGTFPFVAALQQWQGTGYLTICGGTLIDKDRILTAAHCVDQWLAGAAAENRERVIIGRTDMTTTDGEIRYPAAIRVDPSWDSATESDDVAVITLDAPVPDVAFPVIPKPGDHSHEAPGVQAVAMGWGSTQAAGPSDFSPGVYPDDLRQVQLPVLGDGQCKAVLDGVHNPTVYPKVMLCAGGDGHHDACTGDSGGPLLTPLAAGGWELVGITSWGNGCAVPGVPGVFTRLSAAEIHDFVADSDPGATFG
jgi:secreted trypsin-like serine protease